eukprot:m.61391 g.61391  ORF g.61391 m.61391 type:complete len:67 (+) comp35004_c0_seq1:1126-1326(+)
MRWQFSGKRNRRDSSVFTASSLYLHVGLYLLVMTALQDAAQSHQTAGANARRDGHVCLDFSTAGAA